MYGIYTGPPPPPQSIATTTSGHETPRRSLRADAPPFDAPASFAPGHIPPTSIFGPNWSLGGVSNTWGLARDHAAHLQPPRMQATSQPPGCPAPAAPWWAPSMSVETVEPNRRRESIDSDPTGDAMEYVQAAPLRELTMRLCDDHQYRRLCDEVQAKLHDVFASGLFPLYAKRWRNETNELLYLLYERADKEQYLYRFANDFAAVCARGHFELNKRLHRLQQGDVDRAYAPFFVDP